MTSINSNTSINLNSGSVVLNGTTYSGEQVVIANGRVYVDGEEAQNLTNEPTIEISVEGSVDSIKTQSGDVTVTGSVLSARTMSGDITAGTVTGVAETMSGDITTNS